MVNKLKKILQAIDENKGLVNVFAILKMDDLIDKWTLVFSASWLKEENSFATFQYIQELFKKELTQEELGSIARLGLFKSNEHIITLMTSAFSITGDSDVHLENTKLNGFKVHEAYVLRSKKEEASL